MKHLAKIVILILLCSTVFAAQEGEKEAKGMVQGTAMDEPSPTPVMAGPPETVNARQEHMQQAYQELQQEAQQVGGKKGEVLMNQNKVRLAVRSLLTLNNVTGIGTRVSEIARQFNNSVQSTIKAEDRIQTRSAFRRFFVGGDQDSAQKIEDEVNRNMERLQELRQMHEQCNCSEAAKEGLRKDIDNIEAEQNRLRQLAKDEKKSKGLFGWIWK